MANTRRFGWLVSLALVSFGRAAPGGEAPAGQAEILKKLDKPASLTLRGLPWDELFRELTDALECKIEVQKPFPETRSVWLWTHTLPGRAALDLICELIDRAWTLHGGSIVVAPREKVWELQRFPRREYDLTQAAREPKEAAGLQALIQKVLGPPSGTCGARVTLAGDARLAVAAPEADHKLVAKLLDAIRAVPRNGSVNLGTRAPSASRGRQLFESGREWPEWAQKKMEEQTTLDLTDAPLQKVLERLAKLRKTNILLRAGTVSPELPLTIKANDTRFKDALDWVNRAANLSYFVASDLIVFRPSEGSEEPEQPAPLAIAVHDFSGVVAQGWTMDEVMDFLRRYEAEEQPPEEEGGEKEKKAEEALPKALVKGPGRGDLCLRLGTRAAVAAASGWRSHLAWVLPAMRERKNPPQRPGVTDSYAPAEEGICVREDDEEVSPELFERTVSLHLDHAGIKAALVAIAAAMGRDAVLDNDDVPQDIRNRHISLHVDDAPCAVPLALLCFALGANWEPEVEDVRVELSPSSPDEGDTEKELYLAWGAATTREETVQLAALVEKLLNDLAARAGTVPRSSCKARPGHYLDVSAPPNALRLVDHLRSWLANLEPGEHRELPSPAADARALRHKALELRDTLPEHLAAALKKQVQPPAKAMHAAEALADLGAQARATLVLDPDAELPKAEVKLEGDKPTLADALRALEEQTGTVHVATGHALLFTTPERARLLRPATWAIYDVRNLASDAAAAGLAAGLLKECQKHNEWARHHFIEHHKRRLIVCTTTAIHERIVASLKGAARQRAEKREGRGMGAGE